MPCSSISDQTRKHRIWSKTNGVCAHCGRPVSGRNRTIDHFIPKSLGGGSDYRNLMPLCRFCNVKRSNHPVDPISYYAYAPEKAILQCMEYQNQWCQDRVSASGTLWA